MKRVNETTIRSPFRLVQCSDEKCEVFKPRNGNIRTSHHAKSNIQLMWDSPPKKVLLVKKPNEPQVTCMFKEVIQWLVQEKKMQVYIEPSVYEEMSTTVPSTKTWKSDEWEELQTTIDFIVSFGGDGTVLWVSGLFPASVPPVISFAMGSLGFLTSFHTSSCKGTRIVPCEITILIIKDTLFLVDSLGHVIHGGFYLTLRSRLKCSIVKGGNELKTSEFIFSDPRDSVSFHALNEVVIDRGPSAALVELDCFCDDSPLTTVTADGVIIATPTGSTAYSLSAGGSMVHPSVPTMLFTPICPHSLSFRPLLFHDSATLKISVPQTCRTAAFVSFDGKNRVKLERGDSLFVKVR